MKYKKISFIIIIFISLLIGGGIYQQSHHSKTENQDTSHNQVKQEISTKTNIDHSRVSSTHNESYKKNNTTSDIINSSSHTTSKKSVISSVPSEEESLHSSTVEHSNHSKKIEDSKKIDDSSSDNNPAITSEVNTKGLIKVSEKDKEKFKDISKYPLLILSNQQLKDNHNKIYQENHQIIIQQFNSGTFKVKPTELKLTIKSKEKDTYLIHLSYPENDITFKTNHEGYEWLSNIIK